jgi:N-acetylglutamate synthase-like GNAT family acetyltransferase
MADAPPSFHIRPVTIKDRAWVAQFLDDHWKSTKIVSRGQTYFGHLLDGFAAIEGTEDAPGKPIGLALYRYDTNSCEILTLDSLQPKTGIGAALLEAVKQTAQQAGCVRVWLIITNDNLNALHFYQKRGWHLAAVYPDALTEARRLQPQIPLIGQNGIPIRDELELEWKF